MQCMSKTEKKNLFNFECMVHWVVMFVFALIKPEINCWSSWFGHHALLLRLISINVVHLLDSNFCDHFFYPLTWIQSINKTIMTLSRWIKGFAICFCFSFFFCLRGTFVFSFVQFFGGIIGFSLVHLLPNGRFIHLFRDINWLWWND